MEVHKPDGAYLWLGISSKENVDDNIATMKTVPYGMSIVYCITTTSRAGGGEGYKVVFNNWKCLLVM